MVHDKFYRNENPDWEPDAHVEVTFSGKNLAVLNGYRPHYKVKGDYLTTTHHWFIDNDKAQPNEPTEAFVKFITPEAYPNCLESGMEIEIGEGNRVVGNAKILNVYNQKLLKKKLISC